MPTVEMNLERESKSALNLFRLIAENDPDLLFESLDGLLKSLKVGKAGSGDRHGLPAATADAGLSFLKLGDEFVGRMAALGARYRHRGFVVPTSLSREHGASTSLIDAHEHAP